MSNPKPTVTQIAYIAGGAVAGAAVSLALGLGGLIGGAIIGVGAAVGAIPYQRAIQESKKRDGG